MPDSHTSPSNIVGDLLLGINFDAPFHVFDHFIISTLEFIFILKATMDLLFSFFLPRIMIPEGDKVLPPVLAACPREQLPQATGRQPLLWVPAIDQVGFFQVVVASLEAIDSILGLSQDHLSPKLQLHKLSVKIRIKASSTIQGLQMIESDECSTR